MLFRHCHVLKQKFGMFSDNIVAYRDSITKFEQHSAIYRLLLCSFSLSPFLVQETRVGVILRRSMEIVYFANTPGHRCLMSEEHHPFRFRFVSAYSWVCCFIQADVGQSGKNDITRKTEQITREGENEKESKRKRMGKRKRKQDSGKERTKEKT